MAVITIPISVSLVTTQARNQAYAHGWTGSEVPPFFAIVNRIWEQAEIRFRVGEPADVTVDFPASMRANSLDNAGLQHVARNLRRHAGPGPSLACVRGFTRGTRAAVAVEVLTFCALKKVTGSVDAPARSLAHELGHLLQLHHLEAVTDPRDTEGMLAFGRNLMNPGVIQANPVLTEEQKETAQASRLARMFGTGA